MLDLIKQKISLVQGKVKVWKKERAIKLKNEAFDKASPALKRIIIAKDVIDSILSRQYRADTSKYVDYNAFEWGDIKSQLPSVTNCNVCALGACLLSITKYKNQLVTSDLNKNYFKNRNSKVVEMLSQYFEPHQLALLECAFEDGPMGYNDYGNIRVGLRAFDIQLTEEEREACNEFRKVSLAKDRLAGAYYNALLVDIMQNVIDNNGEFIPTQLPEVTETIEEDGN